MSTPRRPTPTHLLAPPDYVAIRPYRKSVLQWLWGILWRPVLWCLHFRRWKVMPSDFTKLVYRHVQMPRDPHPDYIEIGSFKPAENANLIAELARVRVKQLTTVLGASFLYPANKFAIEEKLFHTFEDFLVQQGYFEKPTRTQDVSFGHSLRGFSADHKGYLDYLKIRAPDLWAFLQKSFTARIPRVEFRKHAYVVGQTGAGKSEALKVLAARLKDDPRSTVIILDPERKLAEEIAWHSDHNAGDNLIYIDPALGRNDGLFPILNPFDAPDKDLAAQATYAELCVAALADASDNPFTPRMATILRPCIAVLLHRDGSTLADLQRFLDDARNRDLVELGQRHPRPEVSEFFHNDFLLRDLKQTKEPLRARIQDLRTSPIFADCVIGQSSIHMETIIKSRKTVVVCLDEAELGIHGSRVYGRFFVNMLEATIRRLRSGALAQNNPAPVYLIVDEFARFVSPQFAAILERARRLGLHLIAAQQYLYQGMSSEFGGTLGTNTNIKMVGRYTESAVKPKAVAAMVDTPIETLATFRSGKYAIKAGTMPSVVVQFTSDRLGNQGSMSVEQWETVRRHQIQEYYRMPTTARAALAAPSSMADAFPDAPTLTDRPTAPPEITQEQRKGLPAPDDTRSTKAPPKRRFPRPKSYDDQ